MSGEEILQQRNKSWKNKKEIPQWVNLEETGLDQFFTKEDLALRLYSQVIATLKADGVQLEDCLFIEPAAGNGAFYKLLPTQCRVGMDLFPLCEGVERKDFLDWEPPMTDKKIVFVGNPPFGYRAWLALTFMNHAAKYADYVFFILPMAFQSEGKGSPKNRVAGLKPVYSEVLANDSFYAYNGKDIKINALWQIWKKGENTREQLPSCQEYIDLFTVDQRKERLCGQAKMSFADFFLQRTYYNEQPKLVTDFAEVRYVCGYGIIIKKSREKVISILNHTDWNQYSNLAAHNCRHISMYHIERALASGGL